MGTVNTAAGERLVAEWQAGRLVSVLPGMGDSYVSASNPRGEIAATSRDFSAALVADRGAIHALDTGGAQFVYARRINSRGQIAGALDQYAVRWDSPSAAPQVLRPAAGDVASFAKGINDAGTVAGDSDSEDGEPFPAIWTSRGQVEVFPSAFGDGQGGDLYAINNGGEPVGESYDVDPSGNFLADQATAWSTHGDPTLVPLLPGTNTSTALNLDDRGWVVGGANESDFTTGAQGPNHAFLWLGSGPSMALPTPGLSYAASTSVAHAIDDEGVAAGSSGPVGEPERATVWPCAAAEGVVPPAGAASGGSATNEGRTRSAQIPGMALAGRAVSRMRVTPLDLGAPARPHAMRRAVV